MPYKVTFSVTEEDGRILKGDTTTVDNKDSAEQEIKDILDLLWNNRLRPGDKKREFLEITNIVEVPAEEDLTGDDMYDDEDEEEEERYPEDWY